MNNIPSTYSEDLSEDRIITLANFLIEVRGEVIERHDSEYLGDTPLSLGMRAYECCRSRLITQDKQSVWPWFSILTPEKRFTFLIENTPVRFVRDNPSSLPDKKFIRSEEALNQIDWLAQEKPNASIHWFLVIDTYYLNAADSIYFVGYSDSTYEIICKWEVPINENVALLSNVNSSLTQPVDIDKAPLKVKLQPQKKQKDNGN